MASKVRRWKVRRLYFKGLIMFIEISKLYQSSGMIVKLYFKILVLRRKDSYKIYKRLKIVQNWMACTSVFYVHAVQPHVHPIGGMGTNTWALPCLCKHIDG